MTISPFNLRSWRQKTTLAGSAVVLLALSGCVTCPDGSVGNACYGSTYGQYSAGQYAPTSVPYNSGGYYAPASSYYGSPYYQRPYYPRPYYQRPYYPY